MNCLELWTGAVCAYASEPDFRPLAYPLTQIIAGVARLVPTARYFPLRLRCARMLNRIATSTGTFIPVSTLLLDMLEMKELNRPPTGGIGKAVDLHAVLKVSLIVNYPILLPTFIYYYYYFFFLSVFMSVDNFMSGQQANCEDPSISGGMCLFCS